MPDLSTCPRCGTVFSADSPGGLCPKCLLQAGLESGSIAEGASSAAPGSAARGEDVAQEADVAAKQSVPEAARAKTTPMPPKSGFVPPAPQDLAPLFPQLEILEMLGRGGMGAVYKARQRELGRLVALKILPAEVGADPEFAERFAREARALARLAHPGIVTVYDFGRTAGAGPDAVPVYYFVMEYVDGANLRQLIKAGDIAPAQALAIVPQVCEALQYAHDEGVVHRDVKPENILVDKRGRVKIADFGLSKLVAGEGHEPPEALTGTEQVMGTLRYMAPEQMLATRNVDHRADIYSLGVVFYELLTGEVPVGRFEPPSHRVQVDVRLDEVVLRALEREPAKRYQRAGDVKTEVEAISSGAGRATIASERQAAADEHDAVPSSRTATALPAGAPSGWESGWLALPPAQRQVLKGALGLLMLALALVFVSFGTTEETRGAADGAQLKVRVTEIGAISPWFRSERRVGDPGLMLSQRIDLLSWSVLAGILACVVFSVLQAIERIEGVVSPEELEERILRHLRAGETAQAVRCHRRSRGTGLAESLAAVEEIARRHGLEVRRPSTSRRARDIAIASFVLAVVAGWAASSDVSDSTRGTVVFGGAALYLAFLVATWIGVRQARRRAAEPPRPFDWYGVTTTAIVVLALAGVGNVWMTWGRILTMSGLWVVASGTGWWQGVATGAAFLAVLAIVVGSVGLRPVPWWRPFGVGTVAAAIFVCATWFLVAFKEGSVAVGPLLDAASWSIEHDGKVPRTITEARVPALVGTAPDVALGLAVALLLLAAIELRLIPWWRTRAAALEADHRHGAPPQSDRSSPAAALGPATEADADYARQRLTGPAVSLMLAAVVNILAGIGWAATTWQDAQSWWELGATVGIPAWNVIVSFVLLGAAGGLLRGETSPVGDFAITCSLIMPPGLVIAIPAVILYWVRHEDPRIRRAFAAAESARIGTDPTARGGGDPPASSAETPVAADPVGEHPAPAALRFFTTPQPRYARAVGVPALSVAAATTIAATTIALSVPAEREGVQVATLLGGAALVVVTLFGLHLRWVVRRSRSVGAVSVAIRSAPSVAPDLRRQAWAASIGLSLVAVLGGAIGLIVLFVMSLTILQPRPDGTTPFAPNLGSLLVPPCFLAAGLFVAWGADLLRRFRRYDICVAASLVAVVLAVLLIGVKQRIEFFLGILPGLYAFWFLQKQAVKDAFAAGATATGPAPTADRTGKFLSAMRSAFRFVATSEVVPVGLAVLGAANVPPAWVYITLGFSGPGMSGTRSLPLSGYDRGVGIVAGACLVVLALLLLATGRMRPAPVWRGLVSLVLAVAAFVGTAAFPWALDTDSIPIRGENEQVVTGVQRSATVRYLAGYHVELVVCGALSLLLSLHLRRRLSDGDSSVAVAPVEPEVGPPSPILGPTRIPEPNRSRSEVDSSP